MTDFDEAARVVGDAIEARVFPAAVAELGSGHEVFWHHAFGRLTFDAESPATDVETPFDLASLTKVVSTTTVVMQLIADRKLDLDEPLVDSFPEWRGVDRENVTIRDLLAHASGLPARLVDPSPPGGRREFEHDICTMPLEYPPRTRSIYSDLGFILLGFLAADRGSAALDEQFDALWVRLRLGADRLIFDLPLESKRRAAPTLPLDNDARRGRMLIGEVHDVYAAALHGVAGHAGLFGTASALGAFARAVLRGARGEADVPPLSRAIVATFVAKTAVAGSSRALGWDTMLPSSSCGTRMSPVAFGHVGFTGTSLWIDPLRDRYYILLTNRACGGGSLDDMRTVRRAFHDALAHT